VVPLEKSASANGRKLISSWQSKRWKRRRWSSKTK